MAGNFTNLKYDPDAYQEQVERSTGALSYRLDPNYVVNCNAVMSSNTNDGYHVPNRMADQIDVDSILKGINQPHSKSNKRQAHKPLDQTQKVYQTTHMPDRGSPLLYSEPTRQTHSVSQYKGLNTPDLRLDYPLHDPQCNIFENFQINTRLQAKDNHRAVWQSPMDQEQSLPKKRSYPNNKCQKYHTFTN